MERRAIGGYGVPLEISLRLLVREMKVDEYQPLKWASDANRGFILARLCLLNLCNNWWKCPDSALKVGPASQVVCMNKTNETNSTQEHKMELYSK